MFISDAGLLKFGLEFILIHLLENILKPSVIGFQDRILGRHVERVFFCQRHLERGTGKAVDRLVGIVHRHRDPVTLEIIYFPTLCFTFFIGKGQPECAFSPDHLIGGTILVSEGMTTDDDGFGPSLYITGNIAANDRFPEYGPSHYITDGAVGRFPHLLQAEFLHTSLIRCDGSTLYTYIVFFDGLGCFYRHLVIRRVAILYAEVIIFDIQVEIG